MQEVHEVLPADHYIGIDVGTGSARACVIDRHGTIVGLASEPITMWHPKTGFYEQSTSNIWKAIGKTVCAALKEGEVDPHTVRGLGFDATCSLAVFDIETDEPVCISGDEQEESAGEECRNIVLWLDHRAVEQTKQINATGHNLLRYVGGSMSVEMEIPKVLWLKNHLPSDVFRRCKFYDLADALTHMATGSDARSFCSTVCKQGYVPVGVDGSVKGWQDDFLRGVGLEELCEDEFKRMGGVNKVNGEFLTAGDLVGPLSTTAASDLGLLPGIAVGSGVIDAYAGWIGTVGAKIDFEPQTTSSTPSAPDSDPDSISQAYTRLAAVAGTSTCLVAMSHSAHFVPGVWGPYRDVLVPERWMAEGGQSATGELLRHVIDTHPARAEAEGLAEAAGLDVHGFLAKRLGDLAAEKGAPEGCVAWLARGLFFYGDHFGNRTPIADERMRGAIVGLDPDVSVDAMAVLYLGALEFIALQTRQIVERMNESGHEIRSIFMSGSLARNDILMGLMATACGMPVVVPAYVDAAVCLGAAMLGVKAAGEGEEGLWEIMQRLSRAGRVVYPRESEREKQLLEVKYKVFLEQCESQQRWRKNVEGVTYGWTG